MDHLAFIIRIVLIGALGIWIILQLKGKTNTSATKYDKIIRQKSSKLKHLKEFNKEFRDQYTFEDVLPNNYYSKNITTEEFDETEVIKEIINENKNDIDLLLKKMEINKALWNKYIMEYNNIKVEEAKDITDENISDMNYYKTLEIQILAANRMPAPVTNTKFTFTILHPKGKTQETEVIQCDAKELVSKYMTE